MNDLISRQAAIAELKREASCGDRDYEKGLLIAADILELFPSAQKTGKWYRPQEWTTKTYKRLCTNCQDVAYFCGDGDYKFCPNCGARMEEDDDPT